MHPLPWRITGPLWAPLTSYGSLRNPVAWANGQSHGGTCPFQNIFAYMFQFWDTHNMSISKTRTRRLAALTYLMDFWLTLQRTQGGAERVVLFPKSPTGSVIFMYRLWNLSPFGPGVLLVDICPRSTEEGVMNLQLDLSPAIKANWLGWCHFSMDQ